MDPLLFIAKRKGDGGGPFPLRSSLWLFDPGAEAPFAEIRDFGLRHVYAFACDPEGGRVLWNEYVYDETGRVKESAVWILPLDGRRGDGEETRLCRVEGGEISSLDWTCKGRIAVTISDSDEGVHEDRICLLDPGGGEDQEPVTLLQRPGQSFDFPAISPDGRELAFLHYPGVNWSHDHEIWLAGLTGEDGGAVLGPRRITHNSFAERFCRFSPEGRFLLAVRTMDRTANEPWGIAAFEKDGSRRRSLVETGKKGEIQGFSVSSTGLVAMVYYRGGDASGEIVLLSPKERKRARLAAGDLPGDWLSVSRPCFLKRRAPSGADFPSQGLQGGSRRDTIFRGRTRKESKRAWLARPPRRRPRSWRQRSTSTPSSRRASRAGPRRTSTASASRPAAPCSSASPP